MPWNWQGEEWQNSSVPEPWTSLLCIDKYSTLTFKLLLYNIKNCLTKINEPWVVYVTVWGNMSKIIMILDNLLVIVLKGLKEVLEIIFEIYASLNSTICISNLRSYYLLNIHINFHEPAGITANCISKKNTCISSTLSCAF
jgi:hypothetical protein